MSIELTDRDKGVLDTTRTFRITTPQVIKEQFCGNSENAAKKLVARLKEYIVSETLFGRFVYYRLTPAGARLVAAPEEISRPLGAQALSKAFGILAFCCHAQTIRWRYTRPDFTEDFPELVKEIAKDDYYLDFYLDHDGETVRLGHIVVDLGGDCVNILKKCRGRVRRGLRTPVLREIIESDLYAIAVVVPNEEKRRALQESLEQKPLRICIRIEVIPELGQLLAS